MRAASCSSADGAGSVAGAFHVAAASVYVDFTSAVSAFARASMSGWYVATSFFSASAGLLKSTETDLITAFSMFAWCFTAAFASVYACASCDPSVMSPM